MYTILLLVVLQMQMNIYTTLWPIFHPFSFRIKKWKIGRLLQRVQSKPIKTLFLLHVISQSFVYIVMQSSWERTDMHLNSNDGCSLNDVVFFKALGLLNICRRLFLIMRQYKADNYIPYCEKFYHIQATCTHSLNISYH